jgi:hypothetical protein
MGEWEPPLPSPQSIRGVLYVLRKPARKFPVFSHIPAKNIPFHRIPAFDPSIPHNSSSPHDAPNIAGPTAQWRLTSLPSTPGDGLGLRLTAMQTAPAALIIRVNDAGIDVLYRRVRRAARKQKYLNPNQPRDDLEKHPARESRQRHGKDPADPPSVFPEYWPDG